MHCKLVEITAACLHLQIHHFGTAKEMYHSYFAEYCIRHKYINVDNDKFLEILYLMYQSSELE